MIIAWKPDLFDLRAVEYGSFTLSVNVSVRESGYSWWLSCIYVPSTSIGNEDFRINDLGYLIDGAWCVGGNSNEDLYSGDHNRCTGSSVQMSNFHSSVSEFALVASLFKIFSSHGLFLDQMPLAASWIGYLYPQIGWKNSQQQFLKVWLDRSQITARFSWIPTDPKTVHLSSGLKLCGCDTNNSKTLSIQCGIMLLRVHGSLFHFTTNLSA